MKMSEVGISHHKIPETLVASIRRGIKSPEDITREIKNLSTALPEQIITGPPFCQTNWITSLPKDQGTDIEIGFPVTTEHNAGEISSRLLPEREVLSILHTGAIDQKKNSSRILWEYVTKKGILSDEFIIEIYHDVDNPDEKTIEIQLIVHNWQELLKEHTKRVLGSEISTTIIPEPLDVEANLDSRLEWAKKALIKVKCHADEASTYDILSSCAHVFPSEPIEKMNRKYMKARETMAPLASIDQVLMMMANDRAWGNAPIRDGNILITTKNPANPEAYEKATTKAEKRRAACFCPVIRNQLDDSNIPPEYCLCSAGWFRRQWEGALSHPVKVDVLKSVLKGDNVCQFAIHLPENLFQ